MPMTKRAVARVVALNAAVLALFLASGGCPRPCTPLPPQPPRDPNCITLDFRITLGAFPDTGDLNPDYLVASGTTVTASATAVEEMECHSDPGKPDDNVTHENRRPDFSWKLEFVPHGGVKVDMTNQLGPTTQCLDPTFVAKRGTWRLSFWLTQQPAFTKTVTIEAADPDEWVHVGPDGRLLDGSGWSGRVSAVDFDPNNPSTMYVATPNGGIFRSDDGGGWWYAMSDHKIVDGASKEWISGLYSTRVVVLPNSHIVAATCDTDGANQGCDNAHLFYRSADGGVTWTQSQTNCTDPNEADTPFGPVMELVVDSFDGHLFTVAGGSVYRSTSEGNCWRRIDPPTSLLNGLKLVDVVAQPLFPTSLFSPFRHYLYVAADAPGDSTNVRALNQILFATADSEALNPSWTAVAVGASAQSPINVAGSSSIERVQLATGGGTVYALVPLGPQGTNKNTGLSLYRGRVGLGLPTFERTKSDPPTGCNGQCTGYDLAIAANGIAQDGIAPGDEVAVAGVRDVVRSTDGGDSWPNNLSELHDDHHFLAFDPSGSRLWAASDGGLASLDFPNSTWVERNYGLATILAYGGSTSGSDPNHVITGIGLQDNGNFIRRTKGRIWDRVSGCDGFQITFDAANTNISYEGPLNCGRALNKLDVPTNGEVNLGVSQFFQADRYNKGRVLGIRPESTPDYQLYVADGLDTQNAPPIKWRCADPQPTLTGVLVSSLFSFPNTPNQYLVGYSTGDIWRTDTMNIVGSALCGTSDTVGQAIYAAQPAPKKAIAGITIDRQDQHSLFITQARNDDQRVVHLVFNPQTNTWAPTALAQSFPSTALQSFSTLFGFISPVNTDPKSPSTIYVGTDGGVMKGSSIPSAPWAETASIPNVWITSLVTGEGTQCDRVGSIRAVTWGRSVWERFFPTGTATPACATASGAPLMRIQPNGADGFFVPAPDARLLIEYHLREGSASSLRATALRHGEPVAEIPSTITAIKGRNGTAILQLAAKNDANDVVTADSVLVEALGRDKQRVTSVTQPMRLQLRSSGSRTLRVTTSLVRAGAPSPLTGIGISVQGAGRPTPVLAAYPRQTRVAIDVPNTITLPGGQTATFAGWRGSTMKTGDWSRRKGIAGNPLARTITLVVTDDSVIDIRYALPQLERDDPSSTRIYPPRPR
jgi:hypothetical protein